MFVRIEYTIVEVVDGIFFSFLFFFQSVKLFEFVSNKDP